MIYLHEFIKIRGPHRFDYMEHMADFAPIAREERRLLNVGIWGTVNSTDSDRWPEVVNLWEFLDGWPGVAVNFRHEYSHETLQDDSLRPWWKAATEFRLGGHSRLLRPADFSPPLERLLADGVRGPAYYHQQFETVAGAAPVLLEQIGEHWLPIASRFGQRLVGAFRTALGNDDEVIAIWALDDWDDWARLEEALETDAAVTAFRRRIAPLLLRQKSKLMAPSTRCSLSAGAVL